MIKKVFFISVLLTIFLSCTEKKDSLSNEKSSLNNVGAILINNDADEEFDPTNEELFDWFRKELLETLQSDPYNTDAQNLLDLVSLFDGLDEQKKGQPGEGEFKTDGKGTITFYAGTDRNVSIPAKIGGVPITTIGSEAFSETFRGKGLGNL